MNDRVIRAVLVTDGILHVGNGDSSAAVDAPVHRDANGQIYIPGHGIAGRLREIATRLGPALRWEPCTALKDPKNLAPCGCKICQTFGDRGQRKPAAGQTETRAVASSVWCFDAIAAASTVTLVRDGVGISRRTGTSAAEVRAKFDFEWVPEGTEFPLRIEIQHGSGEVVEEVLAVCLGEWRAGRGRLGAGAARGAGAFNLKGEKVDFWRARLGDPAAVLSFLRTPRPPSLEDARANGGVGEPGRDGQPSAIDEGEGAGSAWAVDPDWLDEREAAARTKVESHTPRVAVGPALVDAGAVSQYAELSVRFDLQGQFLVNDPTAARLHTVDGAPVFARPDWTRPVLPGSSYRGVVRAQAERHLRTVASRRAAVGRDGAPAGGRAAFAGSFGACSPFIRDPQEPPHALRSCARVAEDELGEGRTEAKPCLACQLFGNTRWGSRLWTWDAPVLDDPAYRVRDFIAIDRFTGGVLGSAKFDALPLERPSFQPRFLLWNPRGWELALLAKAVRDIHDGLATVGAHGNKGFGRALVSSWTLSLGSVAGAAGQLVIARGGHDAPEPVAGISGIFSTLTFQHAGTGETAAETLVDLARESGWDGELSTLLAAPGRAIEDVVDDYFGVTVDDVALEDLYPIYPELPAGVSE